MKTLTSVSLLSILLAGSVTISCSKSDSSSPAAVVAAEEEEDDEEEEEAVEEANALAVAYPSTLALSMFPESSGASLAGGDEEEDTSKLSYQAKVEEADKRMRGEGDCFDATQIGEHEAANSTVTCYEFDSDMNPSRFSGGNNNQEFGTIDGTDGEGQACMVTFAKDQVDGVTKKVDRALAIVQGLLCVAKKDAEANGTEVPVVEPGADPLELAELLNENLPDESPITFVTADMSAEENEDGSVTYLTQIEVENPYGKADSITLRHTPATDDVAENGILTFVREPLGTSMPNYNANDVNASHQKSDVMSIRYQKTVDSAGDDHVIAELNSASIHQDYDPATEDGLVNFAAIPSNAANSVIHAIKYVSFDINPENGAGSLSYWMNPGGSLNESARGFLFNIEADEDGLLSGCGISGATNNISIRAVSADSDLTLEPSRYWHPRWGQNIHPDKDARYSASEGNYVTEQCFEQDATTGLYAISADTESDRGYEVIAGSAASVSPPERPLEPGLAPPPLKD